MIDYAWEKHIYSTWTTLNLCSCWVVHSAYYSQTKSSVPHKILSVNWLFEKWILSRSRDWCQIQSGISACVMSSEYFTRTSLHLVRLEIFEWIKLLRRHLHQFQENGAGRNLITALRVNSRLFTHTRMQRSIWNLQLAMDSTFE